MDLLCGGYFLNETWQDNETPKRASRIILCADFTTPSSDMFQEWSWLPVNKRLNYNKAVFTYKALNNLTPQYITDLLKPISDTHARRSVAHWLFQGQALLCSIGPIHIPHLNCGFQFLFQYAIQLHYPVLKKISNRYFKLLLFNVHIHIHVQSTLVISNSKGLSETLRDIRTSTYQSCRSEENNKSNNHI